jgi:hypothetical protein
MGQDRENRPGIKDRWVCLGADSALKGPYGRRRAMSPLVSSGDLAEWAHRGVSDVSLSRVERSLASLCPERLSRSSQHRVGIASL